MVDGNDLSLEGAMIRIEGIANGASCDGEKCQ